MKNYRKFVHGAYDIKYHIVWIIKYRKLAITGKVVIRIPEILQGSSRWNIKN